jgi:ribonuclease HII
MNSILNRFQYENYLLQNIALEKKSKEIIHSIIAIDEVGRGSVAGPVLSCSSLWIYKNHISDLPPKKQIWIPYINDSKKLSEKKRTSCFNLILKEYDLNLTSIPFSNSNPTNPNELKASESKFHFHAEKFLILKKQDLLYQQQDFECISFSLGESTANEIDDFNIWNSVQLAAGRALIKLQENVIKYFPSSQDVLNNAIILMDGKHFLKVPKSFEKNIQVTVTQADGIFISVGFSSILAKVFRDIFMIEQDTLFPSFGFSGHKGYGTAKHLSLIKKIGTCPIHRKSFLTNYCPQTLF